MTQTVLLTLPLADHLLDASFGDVRWLQFQGDAHLSNPQWCSALKEADAVLCTLTTPFDREVFAQAPRLKVLSSVSVGVDHIDLETATSRGVAVGHTPGVLVDSTADLAIGLMLASCRRLVEGDRLIRSGHWGEGWTTGFFLGTDLSGATVGLVGLGAIGQAVARRLQGFGVRVLGWNRTPRSIPGVETVDLDTLLTTADIVSLHTALVPETNHLMSSGRLDAMKPGAILINTARGGLVDEAALIAALQSGRLRAGLDVYAHEPLPTDSPLLTSDAVVMAPHIGSATAATRAAMLQRALQNLTMGLAGDALPFCANPAVYAQ